VRLLSYLIMLCGLAWVASILLGTADEPLHLMPASGGWLGVATVLLFLSLLPNGLIYYIFLHVGNEQRLPLARVLQLHYAAQLLRYLPGRIWGIVFQIGAARGEIAPLRIARANMDWMILALFGSSGVAFVLLFIFLEPHAVLLLLALLSLAFTALLLGGGAGRLLQLPGWLLPRRFKRALSSLATHRLAPSQILLALLILLFTWLPYLGSWLLLVHVFPLFTAVDLIVLCAWYTLASVIGILSALTPAGLGVREALFIWLATAEGSAEAIAFIALFARIWLIVADLMLMLVAALILFSARVRQP
jgi:glycosyltransferase 2 family protein